MLGEANPSRVFLELSAQAWLGNTLYSHTAKTRQYVARITPIPNRPRHVNGTIYMARFITFKLAFTHVNIIPIYTYINECKQSLGTYI